MATVAELPAKVTSLSRAVISTQLAQLDERTTELGKKLDERVIELGKHYKTQSAYMGRLDGVLGNDLSTLMGKVLALEESAAAKNGKLKLGKSAAASTDNLS